MRYRIAREGVDTIIGNHLEVGALKFEEDKTYVVTWMNNFTVDNIIGTAHDLRREDDGEITAEIEWNENGDAIVELLGEKCFVTIYGNEVEQLGGFPKNDGDPQVLVRSVTLKALFVDNGAIDPWTESEYKRMRPQPVLHGANPAAFADSVVKADD